MARTLDMLRLWGGRVLWFLVAATLTVLIAFLPAGVGQPVSTQAGPVRSPGVVAAPRTDPTRPFRVMPEGSQAAPWAWYSQRYWRQVSDYLDHLPDLRMVQRGMSLPLYPVLGSAWLESWKLLLVTLLVGGGLGVLIGCFSLGTRWMRVLSLTVSVGGQSLPDFFLILVGQMATIWTYRYFNFRLWSVLGNQSASGEWLLPALVLGIGPLAYAARLTTSALDEIVSQDYIRTARAKGIPEWRVLLGHALRNAWPRILNGLPALISATLSSQLVVELLTNFYGLGYVLREATNLEAQATVVLVFCVWFAVLDGIANSIRIMASPLLRGVAG